MAVSPPLRDEQILNPDGTVTQKFAEYLESVDPVVTSTTNTILGSADINGALSHIAYLLAQSKTLHQLEVSSDYTVTGDFDLEIVTCTNLVGTSITVTMPIHYEGAQVDVIKGGVGGVTIAGNGTNILGLASQTLPFQYDAAQMYGTSTEWGLR